MLVEFDRTRSPEMLRKVEEIEMDEPLVIREALITVEMVIKSPEE